MTEVNTFIIRPRDGFQVRGTARPGSGSRPSESVEWPVPGTLAGALRTAIGRVLGCSSPQQWAGLLEDTPLSAPLTLSRRLGATRWQVDNRRWAPAHDAVPFEARDGTRAVRRLAPSERGASRVGDVRRACLEPMRRSLEDEPLSVSAWWWDDTLVQWAAGEEIDPRRLMNRRAADPPRRKSVQVAIDTAHGSAMESMLFTSDVVETLAGRADRVTEWAMALRLDAELPEGIEAGSTLIAGLGADRRLCDVEIVAGDALFAPPAWDAEAVSTACGLRVVVVSPTIFEQGWCPDGFVASDAPPQGTLAALPGKSFTLAGASIDAAWPLSGWDLAARKPRRGARAVAPGSVYFLRTDGGLTAADLNALWLSTWSNTSHGRNNDGFGTVIALPWTPEQ